MKLRTAHLLLLLAGPILPARAQESFEIVSATPAGALGNSYSTYPKVSGTDASSCSAATPPTSCPAT